MTIAVRKLNPEAIQCYLPTLPPSGHSVKINWDPFFTRSTLYIQVSYQFNRRFLKQLTSRLKYSFQLDFLIDEPLETLLTNKCFLAIPEKVVSKMLDHHLSRCTTIPT